MIGLIAAAVEMVSGITVIPGMTSLEESLGVTVNLAVILMGSLPVLELLCRLIRSPMQKIGKRSGLNETSANGMVICLANCVPVFSLVKDMDDRGKVLNIAFIVTSTAVLGDHLAYTAVFCPDMVFPLVAAKTAGGVITVLLAAFLFRKKQA